MKVMIKNIIYGLIIIIIVLSIVIPIANFMDYTYNNFTGDKLESAKMSIHIFVFGSSTFLTILLSKLLN